MALRTRRPTAQNEMLGRWLQRAKSANSDDGSQPSQKRRRLDASALTAARPTVETPSRPIPDTEDDDEDHGRNDGNEAKEKPHGTDLESALPAVTMDNEAVEEYEAFKASQASEGADAHDCSADRSWVKGKASIYVDAFNLALDTVLEEESHLFDAAEMEVFRHWRHLPYEAQYL